MIYKLTDHRGRTRGCTRHNATYFGTQWGAGVTHSADLSAPAVLCTNGVIHAYRSPSLAAFLNPIHANFYDPVLWEAEGDVAADDGLKIGCRALRTVKRISLPQVTNTRRTAFAILCALEIYADFDFVTWAGGWLRNRDRTEHTAMEMARILWQLNEKLPARAAAGAAESAAWLSSECPTLWAANAVVDAAAFDSKLDFVRLAEQAMGVCK